MFTVKKILTAFILPPGIFVVLGLLLGLWLLKRRQKAGAWSLIILAGLIYFLSIPPVANGLLSPLEKDWQIPRKVNGDVIVVLGGGVYSGVADISGQSFPSEGTLSRLVTAFRLHRLTGLPLIISGGRVFPGDAAEAQVAKRILLDLGVAEKQIIVEDQSRDTMENARFVAVILHQRNWRQPILLTSASHMTRSLSAFRKAGLAVTPYPVDFRVDPNRNYGWRGFLPSASSLAVSSLALHEQLGILFYKLAY
ncbi:MAG: YdcF family protein [Syntrophales bacterium]|nr:YdcF family protein [Syntrophales bacterium]